MFDWISINKLLPPTPVVLQLILEPSVLVVVSIASQLPESTLKIAHWASVKPLGKVIVITTGSARLLLSSKQVSIAMIEFPGKRVWSPTLMIKINRNIHVVVILLYRCSRLPFPKFCPSFAGKCVEPDISTTPNGDPHEARDAGMAILLPVPLL